MGDQFWIEAFEFTQDFIAANGIETKVFTLTKAGQFIGGSCSVDQQNADQADQAGRTANMKNTSNGHISVGDNLTAINVQLGNDSAASTTMGAYVILFLRRPAR